MQDASQAVTIAAWEPSRVSAIAGRTPGASPCAWSLQSACHSGPERPASHNKYHQSTEGAETACDKHALTWHRDAHMSECTEEIISRSRPACSLGFSGYKHQPEGEEMASRAQCLLNTVTVSVLPHVKQQHCKDENRQMYLGKPARSAPAQQQGRGLGTG